MTIQESKHFINLQEYAQHAKTEVNGIHPPIYGRSPIVVTAPGETKATRRVAELLRGTVQRGVFNQSLPEQVLDTAIFHERTGLAFINTAVDHTRWFIHAKTLALDKTGRFHHVDSSFVPDRNNLSVISGICLFSAPGVRAVGENGNFFALTDPGEKPIDTKITCIEIDRRLQPYEAEAVNRLTKVIRSLNSNRVTGVNLSIPNTEYWYYALDAYEHGFINGSLMLQWFTEADQRARYILNQLQKRIPYPVKLVNPLDSTREFLASAISDGRRHLIPQLIDILKGTNPLWEAILVSEKPERYIDFAYHSYTMGYLDIASTEDALLVAVENPEEIKIIDSVQNVLEDNQLRGLINPPTITCLYPHPNVVLKEDPDRGQTKRFLYFMGVNGSLIIPLKEILLAN